MTLHCSQTLTEPYPIPYNLLLTDGGRVLLSLIILINILLIYLSFRHRRAVRRFLWHLQWWQILWCGSGDRKATVYEVQYKTYKLFVQLLATIYTMPIHLFHSIVCIWIYFVSNNLSYCPLLYVVSLLWTIYYIFIIMFVKNIVFHKIFTINWVI